MENRGEKYRIMEDNWVYIANDGGEVLDQFWGFADFVRIPQCSEATRSLWHGNCDVNSSNYWHFTIYAVHNNF